MTSRSQDWRAELTPEVRKKVVKKIVENLSNHDQVQQPSYDAEFLERLTNIAAQFEDKIFRNSASKESYMYSIGKKMGSFASIKSEASKTTGLGQTLIANDADQSSEKNAMAQFSQHLVGNNLVEQNMQPNISPSFQKEMPVSQSSDQKLMSQFQKQEVQNTSKSFVNQPDILNRQPHRRQHHVTSQTTQNPFSQLPSVTTQYRQSPIAQPSNSSMFQQNQQLRQQHDASEQPKWSVPQQNILSSIQQPLGQQRDVSGMQLQQKMAGSQPFIFNAQSHQSSSSVIQQPGVTASEQKVQKITQPAQLHQILGSQKQSGLLQEGIQPRPQTSASFHQQRSIADQQKLFQSQRSFAGPSSASVEPKSSSQLANTSDGHDEVYKKRFLPLTRISSFPFQLQEFKQQYGPQIESLHKSLKSLLDKATDAQQFEKYQKNVIWLERLMPILSLQRNQMVNNCKEKLESAQDALMKFVNLFRKKSTPSVEQQTELSLPPSGQSQISQPPQSWNGKVQFPPVNLTMTNGLGSSSSTISSMQSRVPTSRPSFFSSLQYSSGMGLEQRNGPSMLQQSARKTGQNFAGALQNANLSGYNIMNAFDSPLTHHSRLSQNLEQQMQKQTIQNKKDQMLMRNSQTYVTPATESPENLHQTLPTTIHQSHSSSSRKSQLSSAHIDQQTLPLASPASAPLTPTSTYVSLNQVDNQTQSQNQSTASGTPGISASPIVEEFTSPLNTSRTNPFQRFLLAVQSLSPEVLNAAVHDIDSVVNVVDKIAGGVAEGHSKAAIGEDLVSEAGFHVQEWNLGSQKLGIYEKEMEKQFSSMTWDTVGQPMNWTSDSDSTTTSRFNKPRVKPSKDLLDEIRRANKRLIETLVEIDSTKDDSLSAEDREGTIIKCTYTPVSLSGDFKSMSSSPFPVLTLRVLVTPEYPNTSPVILDKLPVGLSKEPEDLSEKTKLKFSAALRKLSEPISLLQLAKTWNACCRAMLLEFVKPFGGTFSSVYGQWEDCLPA
ncbi:unnamed protein product [Dovyalis caffra]|uniref:Mediator complex subunit 15 KIX domain-containing protein n=1 Tax=Dovyalis caffra TaxID=77055 RepID=A0AAV1RWK8_9ROSI|nr:unnamed protein product [Dovyalis caffra]